VLIHGSGMNARSWVRQLDALAGTVRLAALDLPGHGESDPAPRVSVEDYAGAVGDFLAALASGPALVVGHSLGGAIAIALAARRPELVRGLVLIATCVKLPLVDSLGERLVAYLPAPLRRLVFFSMVQKVLFGPESPADAVAVTMQELRACRPETIQGDVRVARAMDLTESASRLDVPTLVLTGSRDRLTTPALAARLSTLIRGSRLRIMEGAGHMLPLEAPRWVNREIATFAASLDSPTRSAHEVDRPRRPLLRHVLDRLSRLARRGSGAML
jgi:pimeloyl-ACP methyl ester carboxylesterase